MFDLSLSSFIGFAVSYAVALVAGAYLHYRYGAKVQREVNRIVVQGKNL